MRVKYPFATDRVAGVLVPLTGLRSARSLGAGEFADLKPFGDWCAKTGIRLIQLLPVNDTGGQSSPYSALSANALHPLYVRVTDLPEYELLPDRTREEIDTLIASERTTLEAPARFDYPAALGLKRRILRQIFSEIEPTKTYSKELTSFLRKNPWVKGYAVFRALKNKNDELSWTEWKTDREIDPDRLIALWNNKELKTDTRFHLWLQMRLAEQFSEAAGYLNELGIALKGDIPILMNEDSVDAWMERDIFRPELRAGAPPDMFSRLGQNWGFPIYNWQRLEERDYDWWRNRLKTAAQYYHAFRIDHVLGFFRIWAVPDGNYSGIPGFFWPQHGISGEMLRENGFDEGRVRWLQEPHIAGDELRHHLGEDAQSTIETLFRRIDDEDLFLFSDTLGGEQEIADLELPHETREWLLEQYRDRALLQLPDGTYAPTWTFRDCTRYRGLGDTEKERFEQLVAQAGTASNELWADHGGRVLRVMQESTDMLPCAEDLGVVPEAVPRVLERLGILGLKIPRWAHYWDQDGQPIIPFHEYPELSVCAPSVHDTSTMRGWWENEEGRETLWEMIGLDGPCPQTFDPATARQVYRAVLESGSRIVVFALQDLLALSPEIVHNDPDQERVNIPGTYNDFNWTWRMPLTIEDLESAMNLNAEIAALSRIRNATVI